MGSEKDKKVLKRKLGLRKLMIIEKKEKLECKIKGLIIDKR